MDKPVTNTEDVFARALEVPPGAARDAFVAAQCATGTARREVQSLLDAHEAAGDFLCPPKRQKEAVRTTLDAVPPQGTGALNAAAQAKVFMRTARAGATERIGDFIAALPEGVRREARERIEAGLRARSMGAPGPRQEPEDEASPPRLPGFRIERKLGAGGLGTVYAAYDEKLNRPVAIKVLSRRAGEPVRRRILNEARHAAALGDPAIVMELVEGYPIDRFAAKLSLAQKARLAREVARGLATAHERGLIHRDLKPDNVIVGPDLRPRILDFGLALTLEEAASGGPDFEGTPLYASPEQVQGRPLTAASDVFSFGSLMFKVLTGRTPFAGDTIPQVLESIATTAPPFLREVAVGVPEDLQAICLACLAWNPADRPSASEIALELGRFLMGEPVRLRPKLYDDLLRRSVSEYSTQARAWTGQSIISPEERDALEIVYRRLLADEDHWIIDARRITLLQTILSGGTWLAVVATVLTVWMLRKDLGPPWRWLFPALLTGTLLMAGHLARRARENLAAATFLAGAALAIAPCTLALLAEMGIFATPSPGVAQLFPGTFTNQQALAASLTAFVVSAFGLWRLKMTGFAWTTAALATASYLSVLLLFNWRDQQPEIQALWCLPLAATELAALRLERGGRVRWTMPYHLVALAALVGCVDVIAGYGPTLKMLGVDGARWPFFDPQRLTAFSFVLNGLLYLGLMLITERSASLDLRRASKWLEILAIVHTLGALFANALNHRSDAQVRLDVSLYLAAALTLLIVAPFRSRWRLLVGGLAGCGLGSYLLVDLGLVARKPFVIGLGIAGLGVALGTFAYVRIKSRAHRRTGT